jgi:hypothetical protein
MGARNSTPSHEELTRELLRRQARDVVGQIRDFSSMLLRLRKEVYPIDHTPRVMSRLRTAVLKHGKDIMEVVRYRSVVRDFWEMLEIVDEGVAERLAVTDAKKKEQEPSFPLGRLPDDLITSVCHYLDVDTLISLSQTSHKYQKMADKPLTWKHAVLTLYKDMPVGYNKWIDNRGGRYLLDRVQRVHIKSAYLEDLYPEHHRYKAFTWNLAMDALPLRELVCPWELMTRGFMHAIKIAPAQLEVLRFTGTGVARYSYLEREFSTVMVAHKGSLRELDAIPWLPLHVYFKKERTYVEPENGGDMGRMRARIKICRMRATIKICDGLRSMIRLEKVSLPLARTRSHTSLFTGLFEHCNLNFRNLSIIDNYKLDGEIACEQRTCEVVEDINHKLVTAARRLPALREVIYVLHTKGSIVDTITDTLQTYLTSELGEGDTEQEMLRVIYFKQRQEDSEISINSYDDTPNIVYADFDPNIMKLLGDDPIKNVHEYVTLLLETATSIFITTVCSFFERYPHVDLKIRLRGDYWNKMYTDMVLPKIPLEFHSRLSLK